MPRASSARAAPRRAARPARARALRRAAAGSRRAGRRTCRECSPSSARPSGLVDQRAADPSGDGGQEQPDSAHRRRHRALGSSTPHDPRDEPILDRNLHARDFCQERRAPALLAAQGVRHSSGSSQSYVLVRSNPMSSRRARCNLPLTLPNGRLGYRGDLVVAQALDVAQDEHGAVRRRQQLELVLRGARRALAVRGARPAGATARPRGSRPGSPDRPAPHGAAGDDRAPRCARCAAATSGRWSRRESRRDGGTPAGRRPGPHPRPRRVPPPAPRCA